MILRVSMNQGYQGLIWATRHHLGLDQVVVPVQQLDFITFDERCQEGWCLYMPLIFQTCASRRNVALLQIIAFDGLRVGS